MISFRREILCFLITVILSLHAYAAGLSGNGGFEDGFAPWDYDSQNRPTPGEVVSDEVFSGTGAYRMGNVPGDKYNFIWNLVTFEKGKAHRINLKLKTDKDVPPDDVIVSVLFPGKGWASDSRGVPYEIITGGHFNWREYTLTIPSAVFKSDTEKGYLYIRRQNNARGSLWIDDVTVSTADARDTDPIVKMRPLVMHASGAKESQRREPVNLWPENSSFETGSLFFAESSDESQAYHGRRSLLLPKGNDLVVSGYLFKALRPNSEFVLSGYIKSDSPSAVGVEVSSDQYVSIGRADISASQQEWKRFVIRIPRQRVYTSFRLFIHKNKDTAVWLDALQLEKGSEATDYMPETEVSLGIRRTGDAGEIVWTDSSPLGTTIEAYNSSSAPKTLKIRAELDALGGEKKALYSESVTIAAGECWSHELALLPQRTAGYYCVRLSAEGEGLAVRTAQPFVIAASPVKSNDIFFGMHPWRIPPEAVSRIGVKSVRIMPDWHYATYQNGKYAFPDEPPVWLEKYGMTAMYSVKMFTPPAHCTLPGKNFARYEDADQYIRELSAHSAGRVCYWDLENEPDLVWQSAGKNWDGAEQYASYLNHFSREIKAAHSGNKVLGSGVSGVDFNTGFPFTKKVLSKAGGNIDILPIHPYCDARFISSAYDDVGPEQISMYDKTLVARDLLLATGPGKDIWYGEIGWSLDVNEDFMSEAALRHAAYLCRTFLIAKAADVKSVMYFLADDHIEKQQFYYGIWRNGLPLPAAAVYAATAQILDGAQPGKILYNQDFHLFTYTSREGKPFAALWTSNNERIRIALDPSLQHVTARDWLNRPLALNSTAELTASSQPIYVYYDGSQEDFLAGLSRSRIEMDPLAVTWRLVNADRCEVTLTNRRSVPVAGTVTLSGSSSENARSSIKLKPGASMNIQFKSGESLSGKDLVLLAETDMGAQRSSYRADLIVCPQYKPDFDSDALPVPGLLPTLAGRDYLLPNDPNNGFEGDADLRVESSLTYDQQYLYLCANVTDDVHWQPNASGSGLLWQGDSLQIALDTRADAAPNTYSFDANDYEFAVALTSNGTGKDIYYMYTPALRAQFAESLVAKTYRKGTVTYYRVAIPWHSLQMKPTPGTVLGVNFIVNDNDNDGRGRAYWMGLTPGIGEGKNPSVYKKFVLAATDKNLEKK